VHEAVVGRQNEWDGGSRVVRVDVEEGVGLSADEVVRGRGAAAGDADRLRDAEDGLQGELVRSSTSSKRRHAGEKGRRTLTASW